MRRIKEDELGTNQQLHTINKRYSYGLSHDKLRKSLTKLKPDYIYVHLGINDVHGNRPVNQIMAAFGEFMLIVNEELKDSKIIFSMPLLNGEQNMTPCILELREEMHKWITSLDTKTK